MVAAVTARPWLVQMLEVALARRMCCSRACSVSVKPFAAGNIERAADDAAGHLPHVIESRRHEAEVRAARGQRHADRLAFADGDIRAPRAPLPRWLQQRERGRVDHRDRQCPARMRPVGERIDILEPSKKVRLRDHERGEVLASVLAERGRRGDALGGAVGQLLELQPLVRGHRDGDLAVVRMQRRRHENARRLRLAIGAHCHERGFRGRGSALVHRGVRYLHGGEARDHALELVDQLQRPLAGLRLVGRVGAVELPARGDGPHRRGNVMLVGAGADEGERRAVGARALAHQPPDLHLVELLGHAAEGADPQALRDLIEEILDTLDADGGEHRRDVRVGVRNEGHQPPSAPSSF